MAGEVPESCLTCLAFEEYTNSKAIGLRPLGFSLFWVWNRFSGKKLGHDLIGLLGRLLKGKITL